MDGLKNTPTRGATKGLSNRRQPRHHLFDEIEPGLSVEPRQALSADERVDIETQPALVTPQILDLAGHESRVASPRNQEDPNVCDKPTPVLSCARRGADLFKQRRPERTPTNKAALIPVRKSRCVGSTSTSSKPRDLDRYDFLYTTRNEVPGRCTSVRALARAARLRL